MKYYLKRFALGFLFGLGFFLAFAIVDKVRTELKTHTRQEVQDKEIEISKAKVEESRIDARRVLVTKARLIKLNRIIQVAVRVENKMDQSFGAASLLISLFDEKGLFGECNGHLNNFAAQEVRERVISCEGFQKESFPENVRIEAQVTYVRKHGYNL
jgi:hypothetical protein